MIYILCGKNAEKKREICEILSEYGFSVIKNRKIILRSDACICDVGNELNVSGENVFAVLTEGSVIKELSDRATVLVDSSDTNSLALLKNRCLHAVSIGMSPFDTVTVSSMTRSNAIISIQRSIPLKSGTTEPAEYKISFKKNPSVFSLAAAVVILLNENILPK